MELACPNCLAVNRVPDDRLAEAPKCGKCASPLLPGKPVDLSGDSFDRFIARAGLPVLVDFWADWCGPCKMMAPVFQQVAAEMGIQVRFAKVDTEAHPQVSMRHHIKGIPSLDPVPQRRRSRTHLRRDGGACAKTLAGVTGYSISACKIRTFPGAQAPVFLSRRHHG